MKKIAILGSTGSIGTQTLDIVREQGDIEVVAMAAGGNIELLEKQIREFMPKLVSVWDEKKAAELRTKTADLQVEIRCGMEGLLEVATIAESPAPDPLQIDPIPHRDQRLHGRSDR